MDDNKMIKIRPNNDIKVPQECEKSEAEIQNMSDEATVTHFAFVNLLVLAVIALIAAVFFITLSDQKVNDSENPLTLKTFLSGKYTSNLQKNYKRNLPYQYELKNIDSKLKVVYGIGNENKTYKKPKEIVLVSDEDIKQQQKQVKQNEEKALVTKETITTTASKKAKQTTSRSQTTTQQVITVKPKTTTSVKPRVSQETTTLTTTNNEPPQITTTTPPIDAGEN